MSRTLWLYPCVGAGLLGLLGAGCATNKSHSDVHQFKPAPVASVGQQDLAPLSTRPVTELLRQADAEFQAATAAQNAGNKEQARQHYAKMLDLVEQTGLNPDMFYSVRQEFAKYLEEDKGLYERYYGRHGGGPLPVGGRPGGGTGAIQIPFPLPQPVIEEIERIQYSYPKSFQAALDKSNRYLPYLKGELKKAGLPEELAYLAMIESHFTPKINSRAGAGGMWQFMPATARRFDLRLDSYVDERYNWESSTAAAIQYLKTLYDHFGGNWPLAITAYNMGEGGMQRASEANNGDTDIWRLISTPPASHRMKDESKRYYAKYLAYMLVSSRPETYGFRPSSQAPETVAKVRVDGFYALDDIDRALNLDSGTLASLNPDLVRESTPPSGGHLLRVPVHCQANIQTALASVRTHHESAPSHKVRRGESLTHIAQQYNVDSDELARLNKLRSSRSLRAGQVLQLPTGATAVGGGDSEAIGRATMAKADTSGRKSAKSVGGERARAARAGDAGTYTVHRGDTLFEIARKQGVSVKNLQKWNGLDDRARLHVGQHLYVRAPGTSDSVTTLASAGTRGGQQMHEVKRGEYPAKIAKNYGVSLNDLLAWNNLGKDAQLKIGQKLIVNAAPSGTTSTASETVTHTVARGEVLGKIAEQYDVSVKDILAWNKLSSANSLKVGQKLRIETQSAPQAPAHEEIQVASSSPAPTGEPQVHTVASGEVLSKIASKYGVKTSDLKAWNDLSNDMVRVGQKLKVYGADTAGSGDLVVAKAPVSAPVTHTVASGEVLSKIASKYGVKTSELKVWNNLNSDTVRVGQQLQIQAPSGSRAPGEVAVAKAPATKASGTTYTVAAGDYPGKIAEQFGVKTRDLLAWNGLTPDSSLKIGQQLVVHAEHVTTSAASEREMEAPKAARAGGTTHTVAAGEYPGKIAQLYGVKTSDLLAWNDLTGSSSLQVGQKLVIKGGSAPTQMAKADTGPKSVGGSEITHVVEKGHSPWAIAKQYGVSVKDLYAWNAWTDDPVLNVGDKVVVKKP